MGNRMTTPAKAPIDFSDCDDENDFEKISTTEIENTPCEFSLTEERFFTDDEGDTEETDTETETETETENKPMWRMNDKLKEELVIEHTKRFARRWVKKNIIKSTLLNFTSTISDTSLEYSDKSADSDDSDASNDTQVESDISEYSDDFNDTEEDVSEYSDDFNDTEEDSDDTDEFQDDISENEAAFTIVNWIKQQHRRRENTAANIVRKYWKQYWKEYVKKTITSVHYKVNDIVMFKTEDGWQEGTVITTKDSNLWICPKSSTKRFVKIDLAYERYKIQMIQFGKNDCKNFYKNLKENDKVDVLDIPNKFKLNVMIWREAIIVARRYPQASTTPEFKIHYRSWADKWDEWISADSGKIRPPFTKIKKWRSEIRIGDFIEYNTSSALRYAYIKTPYLWTDPSDLLLPSVKTAIAKKDLALGPLRANKWYRGRCSSITKDYVKITDIHQNYSIRIHRESDNIAQKQTHLQYNHDWPKNLPAPKIKLPTLKIIHSNPYPSDVYRKRPAVEVHAWETEFNKIARDRAFTYQSVAFHNKHRFSALHADGMVWRSGYMGAKFLTDRESIKLLTDPSFYLLLDDFIKKHISASVDHLLNQEIIGERINVRWCTWCDYKEAMIEAWYLGFITDYDIKSGKHTLNYDDGQVRTYKLNNPNMRRGVGYDILFNKKVKYSCNFSDEEKEYVDDLPDLI